MAKIRDERGVWRSVAVPGTHVQAEGQKPEKEAKVGIAADLAIRVRSKVREKYGGKPEDLPGPNEQPAEPPKILNLEAAPAKALPQNLVKSIDRVAVSADITRFMVTLELNGCAIRLRVDMTHADMRFLKGSGAEKLIRQVITRSDYALREVITEALVKDLERLIKRFGAAWLEGVG